MSGLEIAGAVLNVFPILRILPNDLHSRLKGVESWWEFERTFSRYMASTYVPFTRNASNSNERAILQANYGSKPTIWFHPQKHDQL